ncbi:glycosyltransferase family 2 protein [Vibrio vulnificus]|uniref:glycosyltransferase family 2 protein n=1 Tax=Vibrio vulnificus TaxID=672 RepID=UPI003ED8794D
MYTIVIANYNRVIELKRCLDSIDVAFSDFIKPEIIVIEDGSKTWLNDPRISKHLHLKNNGGPVRARLKGSVFASHEYIILLDSDDTLLEDSIYTIEKVRASQRDYDLYGFTFKGGESLVDFCIKSIDDYCDFVKFEERPSDYMMIVKSDVLKNYVTSHSFRLSEIWLFSEIFKEHNCFYSGKSTFEYHQDAQVQLSKKRDYKFKLSRYERQSVSKSVNYFLSFTSVCEFCSLKQAWRRRLIKESILCLNIKSLLDVICLKRL